MIIIGIDPGTATTGFGILKKTKKLSCLHYGIIKTSPKLEPEQRLKDLYNKLLKLQKEYSPDLMAVESLFFFKNLKTALPVSEARGVILFLAAQKKIKVVNITPLEMKMGICGYGRADKKQIQKMVKEILKLEQPPKPDDAADALGIAICASRAIHKSS